MLHQQVTLTTATVLTLIRRRGAEPHTVLASTPVWEDERARRQADERAHAELARHGLSGPSGPDEELEATVEAIARPALEYFAWINGGHEGATVNYTVLAGVSGGEAFVLARDTDGGAVVLASVPPAEVLDNFVAQLPVLGPARGQPLRVPTSRLTGSRKAPEPEEREFSVMRSGARSPAETELAEARRVLGLRRLGGGSLYVAARARGGRRVRVERPLNYIDTTEGRWLTEEVPGNGEPMVALTPASPHLLADRLRTAHGTLPLE
ncbi:ESX secretion-associated protein EspG [Saccharomonospora saliphila]|uniref:ESX secretion-associated protein EspG n=1 Tax=Saccharomonospora saliphila TaxID=369829 RepID=UPI00036F3BF0|nr:ESX secretion-associated protein EspG [Saccharomonospora saliphila]